MLSTQTGFLYDGANAVQELSGTTPTANLLSGGIDEVFQRTDSASARSFLTDALGSTPALTDSSGTLQTQYTSEPFGNTTTSGAATTNSFACTGRELDATGLYYYRARYYDQTSGRFLSEDPFDFGAGTNFYDYAANSPIVLIDPFGLWHCAANVNCNFTPGLKKALDCFDQQCKSDTVITGGRGNRSKPNSSHSKGEACDVGRNSNPKLSRDKVEACFLKCFPNGYGQEENNDPGNPGTHFISKKTPFLADGLASPLEFSRMHLRGKGVSR